MNYHHWSGWPGAFCLKCGADNLIDLAIAEGVYDPFTHTWTSEEAEVEYKPGPCPLSDAEYRARLIELGQPVPEWAEELWTEEGYRVQQFLAVKDDRPRKGPKRNVLEAMYNVDEFLAQVRESLEV